MNFLSRFFPASRCQLFCVSAPALALIVVAASLTCPPLYAEAISSSSIQVSNLTITPGSGTLVFLDLWTAQADAQAQNQQQSSSSLGGLAQASASTQFSSAQSSADALNEILLGTTEINIPNEIRDSEYATASQLIYNMLEITGAGGPVNVSFGVLFNISQSLYTDWYGLSSESWGSLGVSIDNQGVGFYSENQVGRFGRWSYNSSSELEDTISLNENQPYRISIYDLEGSEAVNIPEPPTFALAFAGSAAGIIRLILAKRA